jgi:hypothetical protein
MQPRRSKPAQLPANYKPPSKSGNKQEILGSKHLKPEVKKPEKVNSSIRQPQNRVLPTRKPSRERVVETETRLLTNGPINLTTENLGDPGISLSIPAKQEHNSLPPGQPKLTLSQIIKKMERQARWNKIRKFVKAMYLARE